MVTIVHLNLPAKSWAANIAQTYDGMADQADQAAHIDHVLTTAHVIHKKKTREIHWIFMTTIFLPSTSTSSKLQPQFSPEKKGAFPSYQLLKTGFDSAPTLIRVSVNCSRSRFYDHDIPSRKLT